MLKTGIHRRDQLSQSSVSTFFGKRRFIAVTIYPELAADDRPDAPELLAHILRRFPGPDGTYKRTQRRRFEAFDTRLAELVAAGLPADGSCSVHDLAVSDGGTAVDLFERLAALDGIRLDYTASDLAPDVIAVAAPKGRLTAVLDPVTGRPLQVIRPPFVFNVEKRESAVLYPINRALLAVLLRTTVAGLVRRFVAADPTLVTSRVRLLAPDVLRLLRSDPRFRFVRHDILEPLPGRYDLVRAMNILNPAYFDEARLRTAISRIGAAVSRGGLLATGSNQDAGSTVDGAIYRREDGGFRRLWSSGTGSPVDALILDFGAASPGAPDASGATHTTG
jgi:hypothetical protein